MKIVIASDIHGSADSCAKLMEIIKKEQPECVLLLGDILYHGPRNDLPAGYRPKEVIKMLNEYRDICIGVQGNCDAEVDQMVLDFKIMNEHLIKEIDGLKFYITHGHHHNIADLNTDEKFDVLLHGHTHVPVFKNMGEYTYINPGSTSIPKEDSKKSLIVYNDRHFSFRDLDNVEYESYTL